MLNVKIINFYKQISPKAKQNQTNIQNSIPLKTKSLYRLKQRSLGQYQVYQPEYSIIELAADISLDPSSNIRLLFIKPGGSEPGPDGDGKWRPEGPIPGDGARRGGVALPKPESVSK